MNQPIHNNQINRVLLKPRFKMTSTYTVENLLSRFQKKAQENNSLYRIKVVDHHVVIDVPSGEENFWSPQLHVEIEEDDKGDTQIKGILGPKPQVWTFFMFLHFAVAIAFFVFFVMFYTKWRLDQDYSFPLTMLIVLPIVWVAFYFFGQLGKKFGYKSMLGLHNLFMEIIS